MKRKRSQVKIRIEKKNGNHNNVQNKENEEKKTNIT